jgi:hypothetical protein
MAKIARAHARRAKARIFFFFFLFFYFSPSLATLGWGRMPTITGDTHIPGRQQGGDRNSPSSRLSGAGVDFLG